MLNIFKFSTWNQLAGLKSSIYPNLTIDVTQYNSTMLEGTKITIKDITNDDIYFIGFIRVMHSDRFNPLAVYTVDEMIDKINSYGFEIMIVDKIKLPPNVITILSGLKQMGYNYIILDYTRKTVTADDVSESTDQTYIPSKYAQYTNKWVVASKDLNYKPTTYTLMNAISLTANNDVCVLSTTPEFNWEDYKWMKPTIVYSIDEILENGEVDNGFTI